MPLWVRLHRSARLATAAEAAAVFGERELTQRLAVSGAFLRVQQRALAWRHDAALPLAQAARVQRVRAREVDGVPLDAGLWISAFDSAGLRELRALPSLGIPAISQSTNCHSWSSSQVLMVAL